MKLRLRLNKTTTVVEVEQDCTLAQLKSVVTENFKINEFQLSLNGQDTLENEEKKIVDLDIVSGDLIKILSSEQPCSELNNSSQAKSNQAQAEQLPNQAMIVETTQTSPSACAQSEEVLPGAATAEQNLEALALPEDEDCIQDNVVNRYLNEPMLIRDSTAEQIPQTLQIAWRSITPVHTDHQAVILVLHVLMTEVGFVEKDKPDSVLVFVPNINITTNSAAFKIAYCHSICDLSFTVMCVPVGPMLVIHGSVTSEKEEVVCQLQIKSKDYVSNLQCDDESQVFKDLPKLSRLYKDVIAYPLLQKARMDVGGIQNSLSGLLPELKIAIMTFLDIKSLLAVSQTCNEMHDLCREPVVWRRLYLKDFGRFRNGENDLSQDWQKLYKKKFVQRARHRQAMRNMTTVTPPFINRPVPLAPPPFGPVYPPGGIGGDYDRVPGFGAGLPGWIGPPPWAMFPPMPRPRFDPYGPFPGQNFRPGRGGGIWDNGLNGDLGGQRLPRRGRLGSGMGGFGMGFGPRFF